MKAQKKSCPKIFSVFILLLFPICPLGDEAEDEDQAWVEAVAAAAEGEVEPDLSGLTVRAAIDSWPPFFMKTKNESLDGIFFEVFKSIADALNVRVEFVENVDPGVWGATDDNDTWTGMLGMVERGEADVVVPGD